MAHTKTSELAVPSPVVVALVVHLFPSQGAESQPLVVALVSRLFPSELPVSSPVEVALATHLFPSEGAESQPAEGKAAVSCICLTSAQVTRHFDGRHTLPGSVVLWSLSVLRSDAIQRAVCPSSPSNS
jgi:hypothetical protein